jgi:hypothetical protein
MIIRACLPPNEEVLDLYNLLIIRLFPLGIVPECPQGVQRPLAAHKPLLACGEGWGGVKVWI